MDRVRKLTKMEYIEEGFFDNGDLHGQGKKIYPDGKVVEGIFENGKLTSKAQPTVEGSREAVQGGKEAT